METHSFKGYFITLWIVFGIVVGSASLIIGLNHFALPDDERAKVIQAEKERSEKEKTKKVKELVKESQQNIEERLEEENSYTTVYEPAILGSLEVTNLRAGVESINDLLIANESSDKKTLLGVVTPIPYPKTYAQFRHSVTISMDEVAERLPSQTSLSSVNNLGSDTKLMFYYDYETCTLDLSNRTVDCVDETNE